MAKLSSQRSGDGDCPAAQTAGLLLLTATFSHEYLSVMPQTVTAAQAGWPTQAATMSWNCVCSWSACERADSHRR